MSTRNLARAAAAALAGLAAGAATAACGSTAARPAAGAKPPASSLASGTAAGAAYSYSYYRSMMGRYSGGMMMGSGSHGWMRSPAGYQWMTGISGVPGWMRGGTLPAAMMGASRDLGVIMGRLWANAPGPRVSPARAARLGARAPAGGSIGRAANTITFTGRDARLTILASPSMPAELPRRGLVNPRIIVPAGARVTITLINADPDMAHGLVITASHDTSAWKPMMTARPAFPGSALWFLGEPTPAGMHQGTLAFTASTPGSYRSLCPIPGHARAGMTGAFTVTSTP